jgi:hypothetical protein
VVRGEDLGPTVEIGATATTTIARLGRVGVVTPRSRPVPPGPVGLSGSTDPGNVHWILDGDRMRRGGMPGMFALG